MRLDFIISVSTLLSLRGALVTNTKSTKRKKKRDRERERDGEGVARVFWISHKAK